MNGSVVAGGAMGSLVFWDARTRTELRCFEDSFNEEVTGLEFSKACPTNLYGCGLDGIVSSFDLTQAQEDDSVEWSQRLNNPAKSIATDGDYIRVHTADHHLLLIRGGDIIKQYSVNKPEAPKHLLWSKMDRNELGYYSWDINQQRLERWTDGIVRTTAEGVTDIDSLEEVDDAKVLIADEQGRLILVNMTIPEPTQSQI